MKIVRTGKGNMKIPVKNTCNERQWVLRRGHWQLRNCAQTTPEGEHEGGHRDPARP